MDQFLDCIAKLLSNCINYWDYYINLSVVNINSKDQQQKNSSKNVKQMQEGEKICQHIFVVSLQQIRLKTEKPVDCIVKYSYDLLCDYEVTTSPTFTIEPGSEDTRIVAEKGFNEYKISSQTKESYIKTYLNNHPLRIDVFDQVEILGMATVSLKKLVDYESDNFKRTSQNSFTSWLPILSEGKEIGSIYGLFMMEKEALTRCKSCHEIFKASTFMKHVNHVKNEGCKKEYSRDEIQFLIAESNKCKKQRRVLYNRVNYSSEKRSEKYKNMKYDPQKRAAAYERTKAKRKQIAREEMEKYCEKSTAEFNKEYYEGSARRQNEWGKKARLNRIEDFIQRYNLSLSKESRVKLTTFEGAIDDLYKKIEEDIDILAKKAQDLSAKDKDGHRALYCEMYLSDPNLNPNYSNRIGHDWEKLDERIYITQKEICEFMGQPSPKAPNRGCDRGYCKICCKQTKCRHGENVH